MSVVNLYVGGTGKFVASLGEGRRSVYSPDSTPARLALDFDPTPALPGPFSIDDFLYSPDNDFGNRMAGLIGDWTSDAVRTALISGPFRPGAWLLRLAADSLQAELAANILGLSALRGAGQLAYGQFVQTPRGRQFEDELTRLLQSAAGQGPVSVNVIASTAGGTGAGLLLHALLRVRTIAFNMNISPTITAILGSWSAFDHDWGQPLANDDVALVTRTRGMTGTFAVVRDLELLTQRSDELVVPGFRRLATAPTLPALQEPLTYFGVIHGQGQPRFMPVVDRVIFVGRRANEPASGIRDMAYEMERFSSIVADPGIAASLTAPNDLQNARDRLTPQVDVIEYRLLEHAEALAATIVADVLRSLVSAAPDTADPNVEFTDYGSDSEIARFLTRIRQSVFRTEQTARENPLDWRDLEPLVAPYVPADTFTSQVPQNTNQVRKNGERSLGYEAPDDEWAEYCDVIVEALDRVAKTEADRLQPEISADMRRESMRVQDSLRESVVRPISGGGNGNRSVKRAQATLVSMMATARLVRTLGDSDWLPRVGSDDPTVAAILRQPTESLADAVEELRDPRSARRESSWANWLIWPILIGVCVGAISWLVLPDLLAMIDIRFGETWRAIAGGALGILTFIFVRMLQTRGGPSVAERRKAAEDALFRCHILLLRRQCVQHMNRALHQDLAIPAIGTELAGDPLSDGAMQMLATRLEGLERLALVFATHAENHARRARTLPPCVAAEVFPDVVQQRHGAALQRIQPVLRTELVVRALGSHGNLGDIHLGLGNDTCSTARVLDDIPEDAWPEEYRRVLSRLEERVRVVLAAEDVLPGTFADALISSGGQENAAATLAGLLNVLYAASTSRRHASRITPALTAPSWQRLVVGSQDTLALVNQARQFCAPHVRDLLEDGDLVPVVAEPAHEGIAIVRVWAAGRLQDFEDFPLAEDVYYGVTYPHDDRRPPQRIRYSADDPIFHSLPETAAAAAIEFAARRFRRLHRGVVIRLHGSDPRIGGPTLLALFYLLRAENILTRVQGPETETIRLDLDHLRQYADPPRAQYLPTAPSIQLATMPFNIVLRDSLGEPSRRQFLTAFDAFHQFMIYLGLAVNPREITSPAFGSITADEWQVLGPLTVATVQQTIRRLWNSKRPEDLNGGGAAGGLAELQLLRDRMVKILKDDTMLVRDFDVEFAESWDIAARCCFSAGFSQLGLR